MPVRQLSGQRAASGDLVPQSLQIAFDLSEGRRPLAVRVARTAAIGRRGRDESLCQLHERPGPAGDTQGDAIGLIDNPTDVVPVGTGPVAGTQPLVGVCQLPGQNDDDPAAMAAERAVPRL